MSSLKATDPSEPIKARQAYFMALRKHWPELLDDLRGNVLPKYEPQWSFDAKTGEPIGWFESWDELQVDSGRQELLKALQDWARSRVTEGWIFQAALNTLQAYSAHPNTPMSLARPKGSERAWFWMYAPINPFPIFEPEISRYGENVWFPQQDWKIFRNRLLKDFGDQLEAYRSIVEKRFKATANLTRDAEWTARYQKGEPATEIAVGMGRYRDSAQAVYRAVKRFALTIGLNLRETHRRATTLKH